LLPYVVHLLRFVVVTLPLFCYVLTFDHTHPAGLHFVILPVVVPVPIWPLLLPLVPLLTAITAVAIVGFPRVGLFARLLLLWLFLIVSCSIIGQVGSFDVAVPLRFVVYVVLPRDATHYVVRLVTRFGCCVGSVVWLLHAFRSLLVLVRLPVRLVWSVVFWLRRLLRLLFCCWFPRFYGSHRSVV